MLKESFLYGMQVAVPGQTFDGRDLVPLMHDGEGQARINPAPIHVDRTRPALPMVATFLRSEHLQIFPQRIQEGHTRPRVANDGLDH